MTKSHIKTVLVAVLQEIQETSGRSCAALSDGTSPIGDLEGFDSLSGVEATMFVEQRLGRPLGIESVFVSPTKSRALRIDEIVEDIASRIASGEAA